MSKTETLTAPKPQLFSGVRLTILVLLRVVIGWHFLYEGVAKLATPGWSSGPYLDLSRWIFSDIFAYIVSHPILLKVVDILNIWGLIFIGLGLILGAFTRTASIAGILLLLLYYLAHPPLIGLGFGVPVEGNNLVVNKTLVEIFALLVILFFPTSWIIGLDRILKRLKPGRRLWSKMSKPVQKGPAKTLAPVSLERREILKSLVTVPVLGAFAVAVLKKSGWESFEEKYLEENVDAMTSATIKSVNFTSLKELKGKVPHVKIGNREFSRIILGGNLIGGWAHARDLIYVSKLVKAYHHDEKVFETFYLAEKCGINAILTNPLMCRVINQYWRRDIGNIQFISDCGGADLLERAQMSIDNGASACYVQGGTADDLVARGNLDLIARALDLIRRNDMPAGIGGHRIETIRACVEHGLEPDFWMKTLHHVDYWSADSEQERDNIWCRKPEETIEFMKTLEQPWIAFKTLAAGAITPEVGFRYAFENGADMLCVGMYDFQMVDDVNIALDILNGKIERQRPWIV